MEDSEILKLISAINYIMNPRKVVAYGIKSSFLSVFNVIFNLLSIASIAFVLSFH